MTSLEAADVKVSPAHEREFLGHPIGLTYLFGTEMWERFSYYGMRAILVLYLTNVLLLEPVSSTVIGHDTIRAMFEAITGPLNVQQYSSMIYGTYTGLVYFTPIVGGVVADGWLGQRYTVIVGAVMMAIAEFTLMSPQFFFIGLLLLIVGNGFFKPNISTQVGNLYKPGDHRIDSAYSIFYVGINVGAFFSPLIAGTLAEDVGYPWGFFSAGIGMVIGLIVYVYALHTLPPDRVARLKVHTEEKKPMTGQDWKAVIALLLLFIPTTFFWATYEQQGNTISLWAEQFTDRRFIPGLLDWEIPVTWFQAFNPFMIVLFTPVIVSLWARQSAKGREPSTITKMAIGLFLLALSYVVMAVAAWSAPNGNSSWLWLLAFFAVITLGELYLSPIGLALVSRVAPPQILSMMMGVWLATSFTGNVIQGYIGTYFTRLDKPDFFLLCAGIGAIAGVVTWAFNYPLKPILKE
jgi:POT family proton-dependent oligopeptide transporter